MIRAVRVPILCWLALLSACAVNQQTGTKLQRADVAVYTAISSVDDLEMTLYKTKVLNEDTHRKLNPLVLNALKAGRAANDALIAWPRGDSKPPLGEFAATVEALNQLAKAIVDFTPEGQARESLKSKVELAAQLIRGVLIGIGGLS